MFASIPRMRPNRLTNLAIQRPLPPALAFHFISAAASMAAAVDQLIASLHIQEAKKRLELILPNSEADFCEKACCSGEDEVLSPDSGFSSDDNTVSPFSPEFKRFPSSALRRSRSKQSLKRVRFADSVGLQLEDCQYFENDGAEKKASVDSPTSTSSSPLIFSNFIFRSETEYCNRAREAGLCVASLQSNGPNGFFGNVYVHNRAYNKEVCVRMTVDHWVSHTELTASYTRSIGDVDVFSFSSQLPNECLTCELCVVFRYNGCECWDNNDGKNYIINCEPAECTSLKKSASPERDSWTLTSSMSWPPTSSLSSSRRMKKWGRPHDDSDDECHQPKIRFRLF